MFTLSPSVDVMFAKTPNSGVGSEALEFWQYIVNSIPDISEQCNSITSII